MKDTNVIVALDKVNHIFEDAEEKAKILKDISFQIRENTFNIIYGPSGSGKSTLLNVITGLQKPTTGTVVFSGSNLYDLTPDELAHFRANKIGIVYQQNYWIKSLNVIENVSIPLYFLGYPRNNAEKIAMGSLEKVGMAEHAKKHPTMLSGGEQQRIAVARALVNDPPFIIADEPTGSLDSKNGDKIMDLLKNCQTNLGRTVILVSHNMEYIPLASHLLRIEDGSIIETTNNIDIAETANKLLLDMKRRIHHLAESKKHA